jgi:hypothetical protein
MNAFSLAFAKPDLDDSSQPQADKKRHQTFLRRLEGYVQLIQGQELPKALDPEGDWRASFDLISLASGIYTMFATIFLLCLQQRVAPVFFLITSGLADSSLLAHFFVSCFTGYRKGGGKGELVNDMKDAIKKYVKDGSFLLDLITSNPMVSQSSSISLPFPAIRSGLSCAVCRASHSKRLCTLENLSPSHCLPIGRFLSGSLWTSIQYM